MSGGQAVDRGGRGAPAALARGPCSSAFLILLLLTAPGCTGFCEWVRNGFKVGPNYCQPDAPVADQWIEAANPGIRSVPAEDYGWWTVFNDPALNGLIQAA